ncbi:MAG: hypothetical protein GX117_09090 [Candidatus Hydrogenedentes bacterium]|nr:hypothetical protein [Candidatus Hydrogenedentota bacterium]
MESSLMAVAIREEAARKHDETDQGENKNNSSFQVQIRGMDYLSTSNNSIQKKWVTSLHNSNL